MPRTLRLGLLSAAVLLVTGACSGAAPVLSAVTGQTEVIELPTLDASQLLREDVARSDWAIAQRAGEMATLATECEVCRTVLLRTASDALVREELSGGVWRPWGDFQETAGADKTVELPGAIGEAPYQVGPLAAYMWVTGTSQLSQIATSADLQAGERQALSSVLTGRLTSARLLADHYGVDLPAQVKALAKEATLTFVPDDSDQDLDADPNLDSDQTMDTDQTLEADQSLNEGEATEGAPQSGADGEAADEKTSAKEDAGAAALVSYDCLRSTLLLLPEDAFPTPPAQFGLGETLNARAKMLVSTGIPDQRNIRCLLPEMTVEDLLESMVLTDLDLLGSQEEDLRLAAVSYIAADVRTWVDLSPQTAPTTSILQIGEHQENDGPQS